MSSRGSGLVPRRPDLWTLVILGGFALVIVFLIYPLADVFQYSFTDKEKGALSFSNWGVRSASKKWRANVVLPEPKSCPRAGIL